MLIFRPLPQRRNKKIVFLKIIYEKKTTIVKHHFKPTSGAGVFECNRYNFVQCLYYIRIR